MQSDKFNNLSIKTENQESTGLQAESHDDPEMRSRLQKLLDSAAAYISKPEDFEIIEKAFMLAYNWHGVQKRASGEPYYVHPVEVSHILASLNADAEMICAGLMHDILEDTDYPPEKFKEEFGEKIFSLVDGVTKLSKFSFSSKEERQAESFRRMFMAMAKDIRVIVIKLADRLHNMRTLNHLAPEKQKRIAKETLEIFAPLANRLGMGKIKWELEDMSLRYLHSEEYWKISKYISQKRETRENYVYSVISDIETELKNHNIKAEISGRPKHFYSIYQKMIKYKKEFHELYDIIAVRIKVDSKTDCYEVLGVVHALYKPVPGRFKDYIAMPKPNLYQSLHTTVIGLEGYPLEIQIRTHEMHRIAEYGIAAHWVYKEQGSKVPAKNGENLQLAWLRQLLDWQNDLKDATEYLDTVKVDLFSDEVYAFTPKGDVYALPQGSTPLDFAYRIHTDVGHRCIGAKVNGKIVPLSITLNNGDQVEIMLSKVKQPSLDWMNFVATSHAKNRIRQWFKKEKREENIIKGKEVLEAELSKAGITSFPDKTAKLEELAKKLNQHSLDDLYAAIGYGEITSVQVISRLRAEVLQEPADIMPQDIVEKKTKPKTNSNIVVDGLDGLMLTMATCCNPVPGENIKGVVSRGKGLIVHSTDCINLQQVSPGRILELSWGAVEKQKDSTYPAEIEIKCLDRIGLLKDIIAKMADNKINILGAHVATNSDKTANITIKLEVNNIDNLQKIMGMISRISDVLNVSRVKSTFATRRKTQRSRGASTVKATKNKNKKK